MCFLHLLFSPHLPWVLHHPFRSVNRQSSQRAVQDFDAPCLFLLQWDKLRASQNRSVSIPSRLLWSSCSSRRRSLPSSIPTDVLLRFVVEGIMLDMLREKVINLSLRSLVNASDIVLALTYAFAFVLMMHAGQWID